MSWLHLLVSLFTFLSCPYGQNTCVNRCGQYNPDNSCQCNAACETHGDCCEGYYETCGNCAFRGCDASYSSNFPCQCNSQCMNYGDCCVDYEDLCDDAEATECPFAPLIPEDRRSNTDRLRILTWNAEWLFLDSRHSIGGSECPGNGGCPWTDVDSAQIHLKTAADYICLFEPDIAVLVEVADCWTLQQLIDAMYCNNDNYKPYLRFGIDTATGQNVGIITKVDPSDNLMRSNEYYPYPVQGSQCGYSSSGTTSCSKHFVTSFNIPGLTNNKLSIAGVHFLAFPTDPYRCARREGQAFIVRNALSDKLDGDIIVTGDYNDYDDVVPDQYNDKPISMVTKIIREIQTPNLINVCQNMMQSNRYSSWWDVNNNCVDDGGQENTQIDHMFMSENLYRKVTSVTIDHSFNPGCDSYYSDHWPIITDIALNFDTINTTKYINHQKKNSSNQI